MTISSERVAQGHRAEAAVRQTLESLGYKVYRSGWPDFLCTVERDGRICAFGIEVKSGMWSYAKHGSLAAQAVMHEVLRHIGLPVYHVFHRNGMTQILDRFCDEKIIGRALSDQLAIASLAEKNLECRRCQRTWRIAQDALASIRAIELESGLATAKAAGDRLELELAQERY